MSTIDTKARNVDVGWEAIDIFLFTNGQRSSPPRKYHLQADEVDWWEATLNHLAKSHYGTSHSLIELYTLDGNKVGGPLDLSDGTPYVAVVPPDTFKDASYEKYLMKASRSWEKRNPKQRNSAEQSGVHIHTNGIRISDEVKQIPVSELNIIKTSDASYLPTPSTLVRPNTSSQKSDKPDTRQIRKGNIVITPNPRKRSNGQRTPFVKPAMRPTSWGPDIKTAVKTKTVKKIYMKTKDTEPSVADKADNITKTVDPPVLSLAKLPSKCDETINFGNKSLETDLFPIQELIGDKDMLVIATETNLNQQIIGSIKKEGETATIDSYRQPDVDEITECNIPVTCIEEETQTAIKIASRDANTSASTHIFSNSSNKIKVISTKQIPSLSNVLNRNVPLGDNYIAVINKGDAVNLNVNISIKMNTSPNDISNLSCKCIRKTRSLSDLFKRRCSYFDDNEHTEVTQSLDSMICDINECYANLVMVQCSYCGNKTAMPRINTLPVYKHSSGFFILMPNTAHLASHSCVCDPNRQELNSNKPEVSAFMDDLCTSKSNSEFKYVPQNMEMDMTVTCSQTRERKENKKDIYTAVGLLCHPEVNDDVDIDQNQFSTQESGTSTDQIVNNYEFLDSKSVRVLTHPNVESCTQTEWHSVLVRNIFVYFSSLLLTLSLAIRAWQRRFELIQYIQ